MEDLRKFTDEEIFEEAENRKKSDELPETGFPAICSACGKKTTVPFKPKENWPVYCRDCYQMRKRG